MVFWGPGASTPASTTSEACGHGRQTLGKHGQYLTVRREIPTGRARETDGVLRRQDEARRACVVLHDAAGRHGAEPLADVSLVQTGAIRKLLARGRSSGRRLEEAGPMADVHHEGQHAARVVAEQFSRELLHAC